MSRELPELSVLNGSERTSRCPICNQSFKGRKDKIYCSDSHRRIAFEQRKLKVTRTDVILRYLRILNEELIDRGFAPINADLYKKGDKS